MASHMAAVGEHARPRPASLVTTSRRVRGRRPAPLHLTERKRAPPTPATCTATHARAHACTATHAWAHTRAQTCVHSTRTWAHTSALHTQGTHVHMCTHTHALCTHGRARVRPHTHGQRRRRDTRSRPPINSVKNSPTLGAAPNVHRRDRQQCVAFSHSCTAATIQTPRETRGRNLNSVGSAEAAGTFT